MAEGFEAVGVGGGGNEADTAEDGTYSPDALVEDGEDGDGYGEDDVRDGEEDEEGATDAL